MSIFPFDNINNLAEDIFTAGSTRTYDFYALDENGAAIDLSTAQSISWNMSRYGSSSLLIGKTPTLPGSPVNLARVVIDSSDTLTISGKFIHQFVVVDLAGKTHIPGQGIITINPRIR